MVQKYAVIVDAGSSGSRVYVYSWPNPETYLESADSVLGKALLPVGTMDNWIRKIQPGISTFQGNTSSIWKAHLEPLVRTAADVVPEDIQSETPFYFLATAGLRLIPDEDRNEILSTVCHHLQSKTKFLVPECESHVAMIDGQTEGLYGWLGLNYLVHQQLSTRWYEFDDTYSFLDMGGASAQLAFSASKDSSHKNDLHTLRIRTAGGDLVEWHVFVTTWLGFGANQARIRLLQQLIDETDPEAKKQYNGNPAPVWDPCMPVMAREILIMPDGAEYLFMGTGKWSECESRVERLLKHDVACPDEPCLFNGVHVPDFSLEGNKFVGVSEYWYTLQDIFNNKGKFHYDTLQDKVADLCGSDWDVLFENLGNGMYLKGDGTPFSEKEVRQICFKATWVLTVLSKGFQFPLNPENPLLDHDFQDTFQSAADIKGTEISWTLGRAVLYSSSQIAPRDHAHDVEVGYSTLDGHFFRGGEALSIEQIHDYQQSLRSGSGFWTLLLYLLVIFGILAAIFRKRLLKIHQVRVLHRKLRKWLPNSDDHDLGTTADRIGYGYSYPHAGIPLATFDYAEGGVSTSRTPQRVPSRVSSRLSLSGNAEN